MKTPEGIEERIFAIFKVSYNPSTPEAVGGVCGTCFFINSCEFLTAHHCFNDASFRPNSGYEKVVVLLVNAGGEIFSPKIEGLYPNYDLAVGRIAEGVSRFSPNLLDSACTEGDRVCNLGFPVSRALKDHDFCIVDGDLKIENLNLSLEEQEGLIADEKIMTVSASDVSLSDRRVVILDYASEQGFSGGPLISRGTGRIVAFMSLCLPKEYDPQRRAVAIPISEIEHLLR